MLKCPNSVNCYLKGSGTCPFPLSVMQTQSRNICKNEEEGPCVFVDMCVWGRLIRVRKIRVIYCCNTFKLAGEVMEHLNETALSITLLRLYISPFSFCCSPSVLWTPTQAAFERSALWSCRCVMCQRSDRCSFSHTVSDSVTGALDPSPLWSVAPLSCISPLPSWQAQCFQ